MTRPICGRSSGETGRTPDHVAMTGASATAGITQTASPATIRATSRSYESAASDGSRDVPARIESSGAGWIIGDTSCERTPSPKSRIETRGRELGFDPAPAGRFNAFGGDINRRSGLGPTLEVVDLVLVERDRER